MSRTPTLDAAVRTLWQSPMLEGMPPNTRLEGHIDGDQYRMWMFTYFGLRVVYTSVEMTERDLGMKGDREFVALLGSKLKLLQMRHWFNLAYQRGGYC